MNVPKILREVEKLHANAKSGTLTFKGVKYLLTFDGHGYVVARKDGVAMDYPLNFNTRKLSVARQWLKEWME